MANYATAAPVATSESALSPMDKPNEGKEIQPRKAGAINGTKSFTASSEEEKRQLKRKISYLLPEKYIQSSSLPASRAYKILPVKFISPACSLRSINSTNYNILCVLYSPLFGKVCLAWAEAPEPNFYVVSGFLWQFLLCVASSFVIFIHNGESTERFAMNFLCGPWLVL